MGWDQVRLRLGYRMISSIVSSIARAFSRYSRRDEVKTIVDRHL